ncbi:MAG: sulfatase [Verrucomicrobiaceae bacterium]|nr:sulfatase [Verrucomicrobiaceae bacterium]
MIPAAASLHRLLLSLLWLAALAPSDSTAAERLPNVVIVFADDLGYADIGSFGAEGYETPHLDRLAAEGRRFTQWHAPQAVCSASRAGLLTGCYPNRIGIHGALRPGTRHGLAAEETTLAEIFRSKGYATAAFGKWHLGDHEKFLPLQHGFDEFFGIPYSNDMWPQHPTSKKFPPLPLFDGNERVLEVGEHEQKMMTTWLTAKSVDFINRHRETPFFLYLPHPQPHVPLYVSDRFAGTTQRGLYGDVISEIDWSVGEILNAITTNGLDEHTLVIFTSDNGPWLSYGTHAGSTGPLREGKGTSWEGGVRVPCVMRWPGTIPAGTVCEDPGMHIDLLPTLARLIGADLPEKTIDGRDLFPLIAGAEGAGNPHESYWIYYKQNELHAILKDGWKLILPHRYRSLDGKKGGDGGVPVPYRNLDTGMALYHLDEDISEAGDLAATHPEKVAELLKEAEAARTELGDALTKREGTGRREPGRLSEEEGAALDKILWPAGRPVERKR